MTKILNLALCTFFIVSCGKKDLKNNNNLKNLKRVESKLYQNMSTNHFYYDENDVCHKGELSKSSQSFKPITDNEGNFITDIDIKTFVATNTFWYDKKYFFTVKDAPSNIKIETHHINSSLSGWYFEDSKYRIRNNNLEYFGQKWDSDETLVCDNNIIIEKIELNNFHVLNVNESCSINAYGVYKDKFLFHGCWLNIDKLSHDLKKELISAKENKKFARKIKI